MLRYPDGGMPTIETPEPGHCANCGEALQGPFCHACGQKDTSLDVPLRQLLGEVAASTFSLDTRLFRTLVPLVRRPGFLTVEYYQGRRAPYVSPVTLYFFFSFLMFLVLTLSGYSVVVNEGAPIDPEDKQQVVAIYRTGDDTTDGGAAGKSAGAEGSPEAGNNVAVGEGEGARSSDKDGELPAFLQNLERLIELYEEDPEQFDTTFRSHLARALIFLVPAFALLLEILYRRASGYYIRHLVMSLHLHAFAFLAISVGVVIDLLVGNGSASDLMNLVLVYYLYAALRRVYGQGRLRTLLKLGTLLATYLVILALTILATLLVTASMAG